MALPRSFHQQPEDWRVDAAEDHGPAQQYGRGDSERKTVDTNGSQERSGQGVGGEIVSGGVQQGESPS